MPYRILPAESVTEALPRMGREQMDRALSELKTEDRHQAVHDFRRRCKKLRALLRLFRGSLSTAQFQEENACFRDLARTLSDVRDATAHLETLNRLASRYGEQLDDGLFREVREVLQERRSRVVKTKDLKARLTSAREAMKAAKARTQTWIPSRDGFEAVAGGLKKTYKRAREGFLTAYGEPSVEAFHDWRKRVKYHRYHLRILRSVWEPVLDPWRDQLHGLTDLLGEDHDLAVLGQVFVRSESLRDGAHHPALSALLVQRRGELQARACPLAGRLFVDKPGKLVERMSAYWAGWEGEGVLRSV